MRENLKKWMKQTGALALAAVMVATTPCSMNVQAAKTKLVSTQMGANSAKEINEIHLDYSFGAPKFEVGANGYQVLLGDSMGINEVGMPDLPAKTVSILLPAGKTVKDVQLKKGNVQVYQNILVAPATSFATITETDKVDVDDTSVATVEQTTEETTEENGTESVVSENEVPDAGSVEEEENTTEGTTDEATEDVSEDETEETTEETTEDTEETEDTTEALDKAGQQEISEVEAKELLATIDFTNSEVFNQSVYSGTAVYPAADKSEGVVEDIRGFKVYTVTLYPMSYTGTTLSYCNNMSLDVTLTDDDAKTEYIPTKDDLEFLPDDIDKSSFETTYFATTGKAKTGSTIAGSGQIDYIIITNKKLKKTFQQLADHKASKGLRTAVVTTDKIYKKYKGYDKAEKVRKFIQDAYKKNRVKYILLGGDGDGKANSKTAVVPTRMLYCKAVSSGEKPTYIASDLYYSCLSGTYDNNKNHKYGQDNDGEKGKDVDLKADVYVGRAPVDNVAEAQNFVTKVINYETRNKSAKALMIGEQLSGNIDCSVELAANLQSSTDATTITEAVRKLRDEKLKQEYIELYYDANDFMKSVYLDNLELLGKTVTLLVDYRQSIDEYVQAGTTSKTMTMEELLALQNYCQELANAITASEKAYGQKARLVAELNGFVQYLGTCEGVDFGTMLDKSPFCRSEGETVNAADFEKLDTIFGGTYKEEIRLGSTAHDITNRKIPDNYTVSTLYDKDSENSAWTEAQLLAALNSSPELINHLGHANVDSLMRLDVAKIQALANKDAFFFYSQGCYAGSFDNRNSNNKYDKADCVAEELLVSSPTSGAFACVVNSRYGWYNSDASSTKGPSQLYDRLFWDEAMYGKNKSLGAVLAKSRQNKSITNNLKDSTYGAVLRYCYYEINLLGDPETKFHDLNDPQLAKPTLRVSKSGAKRTLTWSAVAGANKYIVYRSTSKNGTYEKLTTTSKTTFVDKKAKKKKKYFYKVAAYKKVGNKKYYGCSKPKKG